MGQYQRWLHHREVEKLLQAQLEALVKELAQLQERTQQLQQSMQSIDRAMPSEQAAANGDAHLLMDNPILRALAANTHAQVSQVPGDSDVGRIPSRPSARPEKQINGTSSGQVNSMETMSSALFGWSNLPNFGTEEAAAEDVTSNNTDRSAEMPPPLPPIPHSDIMLLPEDMVTFLDQHALTDPRLELPPWLRPIANAATANHPDTPVDQESIRTNRLVQRWIERWGRQSSTQKQQTGENRS
ncbi:MAG: hypothetical protein ACJ788_24540 [Ktedonobacteraceae bacterium]|jgi:hypothetical protein